MNRGPDPDPARRLASALRRQLDAAHARSGADEAALARFAATLDALPQTLSYQPGPAEPVRALVHLPPALAALDAGIDPELARAARHAAGWADRSEFYQEDLWSRPFLDRFAAGQLVGPGGPFAWEDLVLGLFLFGPGIDYPEHAHESEEVYLILSGAGEFSRGGSPFRAKHAGDLVVHHGEQAHATRTGQTPLFGLYAWRGATRSRLWYREPMSDAHAPRIYPAMA